MEQVNNIPTCDIRSRLFNMLSFTFSLPVNLFKAHIYSLYSGLREMITKCRASTGNNNTVNKEKPLAVSVGFVQYTDFLFPRGGLQSYARNMATEKEQPC